MSDFLLQENDGLSETEAAPVSESDVLTTIKDSQVGGMLPRQEQAAPSLEKPVSERLQDLVARDEQFRSKVDPERVQKALADPQEKQKFLEEMRLVDRVNRAAVQEMIDKGELQTAEDFNNAALIFQHGEVPADFRQAFELSMEAVRRGMLPERTLLKQAFDRYMIEIQLAQGVPISEVKQRFGTQEYPAADGKLLRPANDGLAHAEEKVVLGIPLAENEQIAEGTLDPEAVVNQLQEKITSLYT